MKLAYLEKNDFENAKKCVKNIILADKEKRTYFSQNTNPNIDDGSMCSN